MPSLRTLAPWFQPMALELLAVARSLGPYVVTSAFRTYQEQERLYRAYLEGRNNGLPAVPPGTSDHEQGLALDLARPGHDPFTDEGLARLGPAWVRHGGRWTPRDPVHFAAPRRGKGSRLGGRHPRRRN